MSVLTERDGAVTTITLNRPEAMNAANTDLRDGLRQAVEEAAADSHTRAVILTGAGKAFCSGADLKSGFEPAEDGMPDIHTALDQHFHPIIRGLRTMPKPVISAVNGPAVGIGISFALACDLVLAAERAYFMLAFVNIGLVPDGGSSFLIPERIGFARATEMAMLGERVPASQALDWGLINRVVADDELQARAHELASRMAQGPTRSYAGSKRQLNAWSFGRLEQQLELEADLQHEAARTADFLEGVTAFVEKRPPNFTGC
ncbi:enoyl-CoA hydratase/isomerase family protein [Solirubrobacter sp. CPCC 204708]|uniref:Enoyl-CoA hydratase-related protein n=1 Tax=Solirubrobacter deserti TaxID=2282478 RepID=A0ABT4RID1_9ACTN|nr:enoyl-CoA hydratase-related protein [Solirubrobacter deserti]MBE2320306.1 enoyl-CoA hydratase/isomerase family protein [Solirubrobacter deserti]MDA0138308.1 enoyl-CoA hydratase-related protein [Solirubrobacter deserti]